MTRHLVLLLALAVPAWVPAPAHAEPVACAALPQNIRVPAVYEVWVETLLAQSPTLRRQCLAIASAPYVEVTLQAGRPTGRCRASTVFTMSRSGVLRAHVEIPVSVDFAELLAHEFEHVLEQIEGVDLRRMARHRDGGVWEVGRNVFETARATAAGRRAAAELLPCTDPRSRGCGDAVVLMAAKD